MKKYTLTYTIFGKTMKSNTTANSRREAKNKVLDAIMNQVKFEDEEATNTVIHDFESLTEKFFRGFKKP